MTKKDSPFCLDLVSPSVGAQVNENQDASQDKFLMTIRRDQLDALYGKDRAAVLFKQLKDNPPSEPLDMDPIHKLLLEELPAGFAHLQKAQWGLENPDSESAIEWCQHFYLTIPSIDATLLVEAGDFHYYVTLIDENRKELVEGVVLNDWADVSHTILGIVEEIHFEMVWPRPTA